MREDNTKKAVFYSLLTALCYTLMTSSVKLATGYLSNEMLVFFRQFFGLILILASLPLRMKKIKTLKTRSFPLLLLRTFSSLGAMYTLFFALRYLPLVDAVLLSYTRPLFIPFILWIWLGKKITKKVMFALLLGFLGVVLIIKPDERVFDIAALVGLASGMFGGLAFVTIRRLTRYERPIKILFYYLLLSLPITIVPLAGGWQTPTLLEWGLILGISIIATCYQLCLTKAYSHASSVKISSLLYFSVGFAAIFDFAIHKTMFDLPTVVGIILIILGSILSLRNEPIPPPQKQLQ